MCAARAWGCLAAWSANRGGCFSLELLRACIDINAVSATVLSCACTVTCDDTRTTARLSRGCGSSEDGVLSKKKYIALRLGLKSTAVRFLFRRQSSCYHCRLCVDALRCHNIEWFVFLSGFEPVARPVSWHTAETGTAGNAAAFSTQQ